MKHCYFSFTGENICKFFSRTITLSFNEKSIDIFNPGKQEFGFRAPQVVTDFSGLIFVFTKDRIKIHCDRNHHFTS